MSETQLASMFIGSADDGDDIDRGRPSDVGNMIHILDGQTDVILDFITLDNIIEDTHKKSLEDTLETYEFITFADRRYAQHLEKRNRIIIPDEDETLREFVIFEAAKYRDTEGYKAQVFSHASYLELKKAKILYPTRREGLTASQHAGWALNDTGWQVGIVEAEGTRTFTIENHTNPYEFLKRIAREFDVELRFRVEHDGRRITGRYVDLLERIGEWRGREIEFGKDLDGIRRVEKQDIVTALLGLGPERDDGTRIEVLVTDEEALQRWGRVDEHGNLHHLIEPYEIQSERQEMTEEEARRYTRTALDKRINTQVTYETTVLDLEEVPGLENKQIRFGDTIRIKDTHFNPPLYLEARVFEIERSIKSKAKKDIKLGDFIEFTEEEVHAIWRQLRNQIRRRITAAQLVEYAEPKKVESSTPPPIKEGENPIWVDTSQEPYIPYVADAENNEWVRMTLSDDDVLVNEVNYNGLKWSKDEGLIVERSDGKVRSILNGTDGIKVQQKDVNDNWVDVFFVDSQGNVKFAGSLEGATGVFEGTLKTSENIEVGNLVKVAYTLDGTSGVLFTGPEEEVYGKIEYVAGGNMHIVTTELGRIIFDSAGVSAPYLDVLNDLWVWGNIQVPDGQVNITRRSINGGLALNGVSGQHYIVGHNTSGAFHIYPNRESGENIFTIRSHVNKSDYRNDFWIGEDGTIFSNPTYENTSSEQPNLRIASIGGNYRFYRTTSSEKYKADVKSSDVDPYKLLDLEIKSWVDRKEYEDNDNSSEGLRRIHGLIAEDLEKVGLHQFVDYINGEVENYDQRVFALLIPIVRDLLNEVKDLKQELETLKGAN